MKKALLIIDMQKGSFNSETPRWDTKGVSERINAIAAKFRKLDMPIIHIQHDGSRFGVFLPQTKDWEIINEIDVFPSDYNIQKIANNAFYKSELAKLIQDLNLEELYITGCATDFCVESTIQSAITKDLDVVVVKDAHTTADRPHADAEVIIQHYNFIWSNMIPTKGSLEVVGSKEIMEKL